MKLKKLGEFGLIRKISAQFSNDLPSHIEGIGDDCAIIHQEGRNSLLITTDLLVEDIHFLRKDISPFELGHKSLAVNISDIAAMGGSPLYAFLSIALPPDLESEWLEHYFNGLHHLAEKYNVLLLGGDTTKSNQGVVINIALVGDMKPEQIKKRSQAREGDYICVTDYLGDSGAGLDVILKERSRSILENKLIQRHYLPTPQVEEGKWLAQRDDIHAMMDVSDGIDSDLKRICEQSNCGYKIFLDELPISQNLKKYCQKTNLNPTCFASTSGEDYCLLFSMAPHQYESILEEYKAKFQKPFFKIGTITAKKEYTYFSKGVGTTLPNQGFDHFK